MAVMMGENWVVENIRTLIADLKQRIDKCDPNIKPALEAQLKTQQRHLKHSQGKINGL